MGHPLPVAAATRHRRQDAIVTRLHRPVAAAIHPRRQDVEAIRHLTTLRHPDVVATRLQTTRLHLAVAATHHRHPAVEAAP